MTANPPLSAPAQPNQDVAPRPATGPTDATTGPTEESDDRSRWDPQSRYTRECRAQQYWEGAYLFVLLWAAMVMLAAVPLGGIEWVFAQLGSPLGAIPGVRGYFLLCVGGLLGGTIYGAKWLYHAVAKGFWHEDRRLWRVLSPWISLGTTVGVGALIQSGLFLRSGTQRMEDSGWLSLVGLGFVVGYFSDKALAKMREVTEVLFGEVRSRFGRNEDPPQGGRSQ